MGVTKKEWKIEYLHLVMWHGDILLANEFPFSTDNVTCQRKDREINIYKINA